MVNKKDNNPKNGRKTKTQKKKNVNKNYHIDELLLEEHKSIVSMIQFGIRTLDQSSAFFFAVITVILSASFLTLTTKNLYTSQKTAIIAVLTMYYVLATIYWYSNSRRTHVKNVSRLERAKHIESHFKSIYGKCLEKKGDTSKYFNEYVFQHFTYTNEHLSKNEDCYGNKMFFLARHRDFLFTTFPIFLLLIWFVFICLAYVYFL